VTLKSGLEVTQDHWNWYRTIRKLGYGFLFAFRSNYGSIMYYFRYNARYRLKIAIFSYPLCISPPVRESPSEYCHAVWSAKTRMVWLPDVVKSVGICITVSTEYFSVTDRRTDRHHATAQSVLCIASRSKNIKISKMANERVVLSDALCFLKSKFGKTGTKSLRAALSDFYSGEDLSVAKQQLLEDISDTKSSVKFPHVPRRLDCDV